MIGGAPLNTILISNNGRIMMETDSPDWTPTIDEHYDQPQISALWADYDFRTSGTIYYKHVPGDRVIITWEDFKSSFTSNNNNMQLEIFDDGSGMIRMSYLDMGGTTGIIGISDGNGTPSDFAQQEADFSSSQHAFSAYELWKVENRIFDNTALTIETTTQFPTLLAYALGAVDIAPNPPFTYTIDSDGMTIYLPQPEPTDADRQLEWSINLIDWETSNVIKSPNQFRVNVDADTLFFRLTADFR
jgi:hypothetical protein